METPKSIEGEDTTMTPLRSSLQHHPIKIKSLYEKSVDIEFVSMNGFMTECSSDESLRNAGNNSSAINYIPLASADPNAAKKYQIVSDTDKLSILCNIFEVECNTTDSVASLMYRIIKKIQKRIVMPMDLMTKYTCGICEEPCKKGDTYYHEDISKLICETCSKPEKRDKDQFDKYVKRYGQKVKEQYVVKNDLFDTNWEEMLVTACTKIRKDKDWMVLIDRKSKLTGEVDLPKAMDLIAFRINLELLMLDKITLFDKQFNDQYKEHSDFKYDENYSPWLKLWSLFKMFNLQFHAFEKSFETYFFAVWQLTRMSYKECYHPSMVVKPVLHFPLLPSFQINISSSMKDVNTGVKSQKNLKKDKDSRVLDGIHL